MVSKVQMCSNDKRVFFYDRVIPKPVFFLAD